MSYSFDNRPNRWAELEDHYVSILDELASDELEEAELKSAMVVVDDFDVEEIL